MIFESLKLARDAGQVTLQNQRAHGDSETDESTPASDIESVLGEIMSQQSKHDQIGDKFVEVGGTG